MQSKRARPQIATLSVRTSMDGRVTLLSYRFCVNDSARFCIPAVPLARDASMLHSDDRLMQQQTNILSFLMTETRPVRRKLHRVNQSLRP
jgi:hypothetical protein